MSRSQYPYPPDEFDVRGPDDSPVGVHRAPRSKWSSLWPFLLVAVCAIAVAFGGVMFLARDNGTAADDAGGTPETTATAPAPTDGASEPPAEGEAPADGEAPAESPAAPETPAAPDISALLAAANLNAHVRVLNGGGPQGEAAKGQEALQAQGFTQVDAGNYDGGDTPTVTSVWYAADKDDTAAAVAAALGIPAENVSQQTLRQGDVLVIIRSALTPVAPAAG